jgi:ribonuclease III
VTPLTTSTPSSSRDDTGAGAEGAAVLAARLGHSFGDLSLLQHALAHRSWCGEQEGGAPSNERLEFLGDAVLGLVVAEYCYERYPEFPEGKLAKVRSAVVNARVLAVVAGRLGVGDVLLLGRGEEGSGGRRKASILSDAFEAILGSVYLDAGWGAARALVLRELGDAIAKAGEEPDDFDHKSRLQEKAVRDGDGTPRYAVVGTGPDHDRAYTAEVFLNGTLWGTGSGRSKKDAEQEAARAAWAAWEELSSEPQAAAGPVPVHVPAAEAVEVSDA